VLVFPMSMIRLRMVFKRKKDSVFIKKPAKKFRQCFSTLPED